VRSAILLLSYGCIREEKVRLQPVLLFTGSSCEGKAPVWASVFCSRGAAKTKNLGPRIHFEACGFGPAAQRSKQTNKKRVSAAPLPLSGSGDRRREPAPEIQIGPVAFVPHKTQEPLCLTRRTAHNLFLFIEAVRNSALLRPSLKGEGDTRASILALASGVPQRSCTSGKKTPPIPVKWQILDACIFRRRGVQVLIFAGPRRAAEHPARSI
jgi:hypothetical protein